MPNLCSLFDDIAYAEHTLCKQSFQIFESTNRRNSDFVPQVFRVLQCVYGIVREWWCSCLDAYCYNILDVQLSAVGCLILHRSQGELLARCLSSCPRSSPKALRQLSKWVPPLKVGSTLLQVFSNGCSDQTKRAATRESEEQWQRQAPEGSF